MRVKRDYRIVAVEQFVEATRDSGYKNFATAVAELVDNALEAGATSVSIHLIENEPPITQGVRLTVSDNGSGMTPSVLRLALQFGGSTRFNSRGGIGRYGMGLPNGSVSQTRRLDVYTWTSPEIVWWSYLDVDEIASGKMREVPKARRRVLPKAHQGKRTTSGTVVAWTNCDRIDPRNIKTLTSRLHESLGRIFRVALKRGISITVNGETILPIDPLFQHSGNNLRGATAYGPPLRYKIQVPGARQGRTSSVLVKFSELPIEKWHSLSNEEKRLYRISKRAGISVVRSGREIDYGWFFVGSKRKENYDDWWRGEIRFDAELDELFGVTHTKQGIRPTPEITNILSADIERIAHDLNGRVRRKFLSVKGRTNSSSAENIAEDRDYLIEPPSKTNGSSRALIRPDGVKRRTAGIQGSLPGFKYRIEAKALKDVSFFIPIVSNMEVLILLNQDHPFYERIYAHAIDERESDQKHFLQALELLILSAARAECSVDTKSGRKYASSLRHSWSNVLAAFLC